MSLYRQFICTGAICYVCLCMGTFFAWPSSTISLFRSDETTLNRPMTPSELALFGSLSSIGALMSTPVAGYLLDVIGRRYCSLLACSVYVISWALIASCNIVEVVLTAIFISGLGGGVFLIVPVYIGEFCQESIRGAMMSGSIVFYTIGLLVSYILGGFLSYNAMVYTILAMAAVAVVFMSIMKESPTFLMQMGREEEAMKSIAYYRSVSPNSKEVMEEISSIRRALNPNMDDYPDEEGKFLKEEKPAPKKLSLLQFLRKSQSTRRAFVVSLTIISLSIFQGLVVVQVYAEPLFKEAVPNMSSTLCSVLFAVVAIIAGFGASYLSEKAGRKNLMVYASLASGLCCLVLGTQIQLHWGPHVLTAVVLNLFCVFYCLGPGTIPYVVIAEVFLPEIRSMMSAVVIEWAWLCNFIILLIFNPLVDALGLGPLFYIFAAICFLTSVFCYIYQPETKGLPVDAIQLMFSPKSKRARGSIST